jgi:undecaprenyl-diphosphatase
MLSHIDNTLFFFINHTIANPVLDFLMLLATTFGSGDFVFGIALIIIVFGKKEQKRYGVLLLAGLALTYYSVHFIKDFVGRPRPFMVFPDARLLMPQEAGPSFLSGHATTAFLAATVLSGLLKRRALLFTLAGIAAFSRVYMGVHYPSDALAGAMLGALLGYGLLRFARYTHIG